MSETPAPNVVLKEYRILDINLQPGYYGNLGVYIRRSQRIPTPYYILGYEVLPSYQMSITRGYAELYISENASETTTSILNARNIINIGSNINRVYAHSYYLTKFIELNLYVTRESFIYALLEQTAGVNGAWAAVKILIPSQQTRVL